MDRFASLVAARMSWLAALVVTLCGVATMMLLSSGDSAERSPVPLPPSAESARAAEAVADFPGGESSPVLVVITRVDGGPLSPADFGAAAQARDRALSAAGTAASSPIGVVGGAPVIPSDDQQAAIVAVPLDSGLSGFALSDQVTAVRDATKDGLPSELRAQVTGGPAFGADIANSFAGANITLLAVTALVVAVLLIVTYRSPILWLVPLAVIGFADRVAAIVGTAVADAVGLSTDGSTSGITSVLVFGAGTNYALLLISRYREELGRAGGDHRAALRIAVRHAGPAVIASNATVVLALLTLVFASSPSTRGLGVQAAAGLVVAAVFVLCVLPPLLALFGTRLFWPFVPRPDAAPLTTTGFWHRIAEWVSRHAGRVATVAILVLTVLAGGILGTPIGLSATEQFRVQAESVAGFETLAQHFPGGLGDPTRVVAASDNAAAVQQAITSTPGVVTATEAGRSSGLTQWTVVTDTAPATERAFDLVVALRDSVHEVDPDALVGGSDAQALDARDAAVRDRWVVMPLILGVVLAVLYVLLRAALAPLLLVGVTVLGALAALGLGGWLSVHLFGFPALDATTPLFAFLFLVALGVDYTIFLVTRAREETPEHGTRGGIVRAVSATGAVITSAGIVLAAVFCVLGVLPLIVLTQIGIIVGIGILLDTFVVRTVVIPALFTVIGPAVWWPARYRDEGDRPAQRGHGRHRAGARPHPQ